MSIIFDESNEVYHANPPKETTMNKLYATINRTTTPTAGGRHRLLESVAQSLEGSVSAVILIKDDGTHLAQIRRGEGSDSRPSRCVWEGTLANLLAKGNIL